jgi:hypothetical protein
MTQLNFEKHLFSVKVNDLFLDLTLTENLYQNQTPLINIQ